MNLTIPHGALLRLFLVTIAAVAVSSCASTSRTMIGQPRPAISATSVRLYERAPRNFDQIAIVQGRTGNELRAQAAAVGANGLLVRDVITRPGPTIGFGIGSSTFSTSRRSAVGVGTGASFITPLRGGQVIEALAIYVR